jgi:hypothetical protein
MCLRSLISLGTSFSPKVLRSSLVFFPIFAKIKSADIASLTEKVLHGMDSDEYIQMIQMPTTRFYSSPSSITSH